ncbi:glycosyltransferase [Clostridium sporogenes]|uniref:tetratricopeptide repeat-containing glycosyltransferase family 2 protein n=1 Tax=Clostridium sporogenes TaxID=1509 RepID=UPI0013D22B1F|nr:TPR domain-containing glycosyltransferase [Clostridium sporogenes]MCW6095154.1 glycosyltransferase [Clostridium sporogenes]NFG97109.1 glycosyltransferase [Clostridium sporogenes]NFH31859.1 glycosyltransferase [Clostridium sporogenes]NFL20338.1 glycosyltransferase [Clostridium sporogenes]NFN73650.1 glycosyltransferase [Clostridium sporogenes]
MGHDISLCMIVKNEEENLGRCLKSVQDLVDEIIVVDTGSTDKTVEIAKEYGAKVHYFEWCNDFSAARNESLKYASKNWILILDGDDEFCSEDKEKFKNLIKKDLNEDTIYFFETLNYSGYSVTTTDITINLNPRLFKNNYGFHYEGEVHNQLVNYEKDVKGETYDIRIYHYGYLNKNIVSKDKRNRNITLLREQIKKGEDIKFAYFNLGNEYFALDDKKSALDNYYKSYNDFDPSTGYASRLIERIVISNYTLKDYDKALEFIEIGTRYYPEFTDLYYLKGLILKEENSPLLAIKAFEKCIGIGEPPSVLKSIYGVGGFRPKYELSKIYMDLKDYDTAYKYSVDTIKAKPDFLVPLYNICHILKEKKFNIEEMKEIIENFFTDFPREYPIIADLFYMEGDYETALEYINKSEKSGVFSENLKIFKVKSLLYSGKIDECIKYIDTIDEKNLYYFQIMMYKSLCFIIKDKYDLALVAINQFNKSNLSEYNRTTLKVYKEMLNLFTNKNTNVLSEDKTMLDFTPAILQICEVMLINKEFNKFEKTLNLLNLISDQSVLLNLGKLYFKYDYKEMAKKEIIRSIKMFEVIDKEGANILESLL